MPELARFHLAFPVDDLGRARAFYEGALGCAVGRSSSDWIDFEFFGHQLTAHQVAVREADAAETPVDGQRVPVRHFGIVLARGAWDALGARLREARVPFLVEPHTRFQGLVGEQSTFFVADPAGNALEFKTFADDTQVFAR